MERFAIKIDKSLKARLKNLCRLCGIDNPNQIEILNAAEWIDLTIEGEVPLNRKIADCVGIEVLKNDRMPQRICALCVDKINDFYEFREMCHATNVQTRKLLNLPDVTKAKASKKVTIKTEEDGIESILGISGSGEKPKSEPVQKGSKKTKKGATTVSTSNDANRFRGMTKREIEITLELERIKKEEEEEEEAKVEITPANRTKNGKNRKIKGNEKIVPDTALLAPKEPNQREKKREMEQKRLEKKRKADTKVKTPLPKKIKKEPGVGCSICDEKFPKVSLRDAHMIVMHRPSIADYGCSTCLDQFETLEENIAHNEWHWKSSTPFKCVICNKQFAKSIGFQKHVSNCAHSTYASTSSFAGNIYCSICKLEFETQNLYDWHSCFLSDNSPCPQCARVFVKRTVVIKHMFKCVGPPNVVVPVPKRPAKGKAKKKTAKGGQKSKNQLEMPPQNSFKFEPETIIEQNIDGGDAFDAMDNSFMDTHFADSDNEFEPMNSIMPSTELGVQSESTTEPVNEEEINANAIETPAEIPILTNLSHPLLECRVKLEPLDVTSLVPPAVVAHPEPKEPRSQLTVPPLTIRIKKEVIRPGYGDEFDINLARSIKQERVDETYELASSSTSAHSSKQGAKKNSKNLDKIKKLYKKPALLAIKIKQERMERETNDDEYNDSYPDYSMPSDDYSVLAANQSFDTTNSLPIITQIHSVIGPSSIIPMASEPPINQRLSIPINTAETSQQINCTPFMPIRIKSEFQRPLSPPSTTDSDATKQMNETVETENVSICTESTTMPEIANNLTENQDKEPEKELESSNREQESEVTNSEPQQMECDTNLIVNDVANDQPSSTVDDISKDATAMDEDNKSEIVDDQQPSESNEVAENIAPLPFSIENVVSEQNVDANSISNIELPSERQETIVKPLDNEIRAVESSENMLANHDTAVNDENVDSTSQHSTNSLEKELNILSNSSLDVGCSQPVLKPIEPSICDGNNAIDIHGTNDSSNISPIDFIEPTTNDDSLNFIDQLVHEVADTMDTQAVDKIAIINENIPVSTSNMPFEATSFNYNVDLVEADTEIRDETNLKTDESLEKPASSVIPLTVPDIPDIDCDLLPVLNAMEAKSNGNEMINDCTPADENPVTQVNIANLIHTDDGTVDDNNQPKGQINE